MITAALKDVIDGTSLYVFNTGTGWACMWVGRNTTNECASLKGMLSQLKYRHCTAGFVFNDDEALSKFLADPDLAYADAQRFITLVRPFEQRYALTLDEVIGQALEVCGPQYEPLEGGSHHYRVFNGTITMEDRPLLGPPLFDQNPEADLSVCLTSMATDDHYAYQHLKMLERETARRKAFRRLPQKVMAPITAMLTGPPSGGVLDVSLEDGRYIVVPEDPARSSFAVVVFDGEAEIYAECTSFYTEYTASAESIAANVFRLKDDMEPPMLCCTTQEIVPVERTVPLDILTAQPLYPTDPRETP